MKSFEVSLFYGPEITDRVIVVSILVRQRDQSGAFKRIWHHAIVLWVDERRVHQLATAANFLIADLYAPIDLSKDADRILRRSQQLCAAFIGRSEDRLRSIAGYMHPEHVTDKARSKCHPAPASPGLRFRSIKVVARQIIRSGHELQQGIAKECRCILGILPIDLVHVRLGRKFLQGPGQALLICNLLAVGRQKLLRFGFRDHTNCTNASSDPTSNDNPSGKRNLLRLGRPH